MKRYAREYFLWLLVSFMVFFPVEAQQTSAACTAGMNVVAVPCDSETIVVSSTAIGFTAATWNPTSTKCGQGSGGAIQASFYTTGDVLTFWLDGRVPTAGVGIGAAVGSLTTVCRASLANFRAIRTTNDSTIYVQYFRLP